MVVKFGSWLPMHAWPNLTYRKVARIKEYAVRAEVLGFDDVWGYDHLVKGSGLYDVGWLEPMTVMSHVAAVTSTIQLGTSVIVLPTRHPVVLAKEIATLDFLAAGRFIVGVGSGWNEREFLAVGARKEERGRRTDEIIEALRRLLTEDEVTFEGDFYQFDEITIEPRPPRMPEIWVGGGSSLGGGGLASTVLDRIVASDGWLGRAAGSDDLLISDREEIHAARQSSGRDVADFSFAHCNYCHLVPTGTRDQVSAQQMRAYTRVVGDTRTPEQLQTSYLLGTIDEIIARLKSLEERGINHVILGPLGYLPEQLELWAKYIFPHFDRY